MESHYKIVALCIFLTRFEVLVSQPPPLQIFYFQISMPFIVVATTYSKL